MSTRFFGTNVRFLLVPATLVVFLLFAGCQQGGTPQQSAEEVLKSAMEKMTEVKADSFEVSFDGNFRGSEERGSVDFDFMLSGAVDALDPEDPKIDLTVDGTFSVEGMEDGESRDVNIDAAASLLLDKENVWFNVMKLDLVGDDVPQLPSMITSLFDIWYVLPLPPEVQQELTASLIASEEGMTPEALEVKRIFTDADVFTNPQYVGTENIKGSPAWRYSVTVDKQSAVDAFLAVSELGGTPSADIQQLRSSITPATLNSFDISAEVWVDEAAGVVSQMELTVNILATDATEGMSGTIHYRSTASNFDQPLTLDIPENVQPFPIEMLMGMMMGSSMMNDPSMMEGTESMMQDDAAMMMNAEDLL